MDHELAPQPPPSPEELSARIDEQHANDLITMFGRTMTFKQFSDLRGALCPVKSGEQSIADDIQFKVNALEKNGNKVDEIFTSFVTQHANKKLEAAKTENKKTDDQIVKNENKPTDNKRTSTTASEAGLGSRSVKKAEAIPVKSFTIHPEIMARVVTLEKPKMVFEHRVEPVKKSIEVKKVDAVVTVAPSKPPIKEKFINKSNTKSGALTEKLTVIQKPIVIPKVSRKIEKITPRTVNRTVAKMPERTAALATVLSKVETLTGYEKPPLREEVSLAESVNYKEPDSVVSIESNEAIPLPTSTESIFDEDGVALNAPVYQPGYDDLPRSFEASAETEPSIEIIEIEKTPAVAVAEFMLQVLPAVTHEVYERVQVMEPEEAAEVAVQIETISIVADRLHELVVEDKTEGEEAKQIEAYLKREYEQLLVAVVIEPTEEIINDFIRYIYSAEYQIQAQLNMNDIEVIDEGTHERKIFDEQGVFARAQAASANLSRRLDKTIGRLVVNYFSV